MLRLFWLVLILGGISVLFAQVLKAYGPGYVLFYYNHYSIETSVWIFLLSVLLLTLIFFVCYKILVKLFCVIRHLINLPAQTKQKKQQAIYQQGILAFQGQDWQQASSQLLTSAATYDRPFVSYLLSAKAFIALADYAQAQQTLEKAKQCKDKDELSLLLVEVDLKQASQDTEGAIQMILSADKVYKKAPKFLKKVWQLFEQTQRVEVLKPFVKTLNQQKLLTNEQLVLADKILFLDELTQLTPAGLKPLKKLWKQHIQLHTEPQVIIAFSQAILAYSPELSVATLEQALQKHWDSKIVSHYIDINADKLAAKDFLQGFADKQSATAFYNLILGKLNLMLTNFKEAEQYLQKSLAITPQDEGYYLLAACYAQQNKPDDSLKALSPVFT